MPCLLLAPCSPARLDEALTAGASVAVADLTMAGEPPRRRREVAGTWLREARVRASPALYVQIHDLASGGAEDDLDGLFPGAPDGILLPGCRSAEDVQWLGAKLAVREADHGLPDGGIKIVAVVSSSAAAVLALGTYGHCGGRLAGLLWDGDALASDLSLGAGKASAPLAVGRALTILAARAAGVPAFDTCVSASPGGVTQACRRGRRDGFRGAVTRNPAQARLIMDAYGAA